MLGRAKKKTPPSQGGGFYPLARLVGPEAQGHGIRKPLGGGADAPGASPKARQS